MVIEEILGNFPIQYKKMKKFKNEVRILLLEELSTMFSESLHTQWTNEEIVDFLNEYKKTFQE